MGRTTLYRWALVVSTAWVCLTPILWHRSLSHRYEVELPWLPYFIGPLAIAAVALVGFGPLWKRMRIAAVAVLVASLLVGASTVFMPGPQDVTSVNSLLVAGFSITALLPRMRSNKSLERSRDR